MSGKRYMGPRTCEHCGRSFERKRYGGRLEDCSRFLRRKYCSLSCANSKTEGLSNDGWRHRARRLRGKSCENCGSTNLLAAHHIDMDITNNSPANIETLCASCHAKHHHGTLCRESR